MRSLIAVVCLISWQNCRGFNVDTKFPVFYSGPNGSYFGYSVALHQNSQGFVALIAAPKANSTTIPEQIYEPGALFRCSISSVGMEKTCQEIAILKGGSEITGSGEFVYRNMRDSMWLGVSLDIRQNTTRNDIVVCGHRWINNYFPGHYFVNGVCYIIDPELNSTLRELLPLIQKGKQIYVNRFNLNDYYFAYGQLGISAAYSEDGSNLILGAPGIAGWAGSFISYDIKPRNGHEKKSKSFVLPPYESVDYNSYFGYSVSTGNFFANKGILSVVGIPRSAEHFGEAYIINSDKREIDQKLRGAQLCEYFGASVLGVNLNKDPYTDLLVGAPLHSTESAGDEGKVYVYVSDGFSLVLQTVLAGDRKLNARFGTCMANIGDINQDGFTDIAIGAPYENEKGALYIYHSTANGLKSHYEQKIKASDFGRKISGFGIHISRGVDIDNNGYPDILVGSYTSSNAVLLRSRPVVNVSSELIFHPEKINMDFKCETGGMNITCVQIKACLAYQGKHVPSHLEFQFKVLIQDEINRAFISQDTSESANNSVILEVSRKKCLNFKFFVLPGITDIITPIQVHFSHKLKTSSDYDRSTHKIFPIYHPSSAVNVTSSINFHSNWCTRGECLSNLKLSAEFHNSRKRLQITLGKESSISVIIAVTNEGEPAYSSQLHIYLPEEIPVIQQADICDASGREHGATLVCELGNPLLRDSEMKETKIEIKLDTTKIPSHTKDLEISLKCVTISKETKLDDNNQILRLLVKKTSDIGVTGITSNELIVHDENETLSTTISHTYVVTNHGPSPVQRIDFSLQVPISTSNGLEPFLIFTGIELDRRKQSEVSATCDEVLLEMLGIKPAGKSSSKGSDDDLDEERSNFTYENAVTPSIELENRHTIRPMKENRINSAEKREILVTCSNDIYHCILLQCSASPFPLDIKFARISVSFKINFKAFEDQLGPWKEIQIRTNSYISLIDESVKKEYKYSDTAQVKTTIISKVPHISLNTPAWMHVISIIVGGLLLALVVFLLRKIGFFRRKEKEILQQMLLALENHVQDDPEDHNYYDIIVYENLQY